MNKQDEVTSGIFLALEDGFKRIYYIYGDGYEIAKDFAIKYSGELSELRNSGIRIGYVVTLISYVLRSENLY